jgi:hypothetical protein
MPNAMPPAAAIPFNANIDNGIVTYDANGGIHGIQWTTVLVGAQYYFPGLDGNLWISGNYSHAESPNIDTYTNKPGVVGSGAPTAVFKSYDWFDAMIFGRPVPPVLFGLEYANFFTRYVDGAHGLNHRVQLSGFYIF